jgi:hypothetical protein
MSLYIISSDDFLMRLHLSRRTLYGPGLRFHGPRRFKPKQTETK